MPRPIAVDTAAAIMHVCVDDGIQWMSFVTALVLIKSTVVSAKVWERVMCRSSRYLMGPSYQYIIMR